MSAANHEGTSDDHLRRLIESAAREATDIAQATLVSLPPPGLVPGYEITAELGRGGMGVVYRAIQLATKRDVALKVMLSGGFSSRSAHERFQREIELSARFQHNGIVRIFEAGKTITGQPFYTMELIDGLSLSDWLLVDQPDVSAILHVFAKICTAIGHAHQGDVIHRDLKPANVMIDADGEPHVLDFGLSKALDETDGTSGITQSISAPGQILGTLRYLSPEQASGAPSKVDTRADVYSLGVMLYEALTGRMPYDPIGSATAIVHRICGADPIPPSSLTRHVDRELEAIVLKALLKDPTQRYADSNRLGQDIQRYLRGEPTVARPATALDQVRRQIGRQRTRIATVAIASCLIVLGLAGGVWWHRHSLSVEEAHQEQGARRAVP
ncbi:MAG: serine/threonine protein kinase [Phycisphaerae bacterium]|nr:serine/threonine protein kinase [Phycisphaerae bacterium]